MKKVFFLLLCSLMLLCFEGVCGAVDDYDGEYSLTGCFDEQNETFTVKVYYKSSTLTNLAGFGVYANPEKMVFVSAVYEEAFDSLYTSEMGSDYICENGVFFDGWFPKSGYIDATEEVLLLTLNYTMTKANYKLFSETEDFSKYTLLDNDNTLLWDGTDYLFTPHEPQMTVTAKKLQLGALTDITPRLIIGDTSLDGVVTTYDASLVLQHIVGNTVLNGDALLCANTNGNITLETYDASLILQYIVNISTGYNIGMPISK